MATSKKSKTCNRCGKSKDVSLFPKDKKQSDHVSTWCKQCWKDYRNEKKTGVKSKAANASKSKASKPAPKAKSPKQIKASQADKKVKVAKTPPTTFQPTV